MAMALWDKLQSQRELRLPRTASVVNNNDDDVPTAAAVHTQVPAHFEYAEEAKRAAQRYFEQIAHIEQVTTERDDWRSRALAAEHEVARLLKRETALLAQLDAKSNAAINRAEEYKTTLTVIGVQYASAAKLLLAGFAALDEAGVRVEVEIPRLAAALQKPDDDPLPRVVTQGPRE